MKQEDCVSLLQWCLPRLHMRWEGFRKVRGQVCKRIDRRMDELGLEHVDAYRTHLVKDDEEWAVLGQLCRVTISRFYRDRRVFDRLSKDVLPAIARRSGGIRCWSAGCASGEEPYTLAICWRHAARGASEARHLAAYDPEGLQILATDLDEHMLDRARTGCFQRGTLKELEDAVVERAFDKDARRGEPFCIRPEYRQRITWRQHDVRDEPPDGPFDLILCRNLAFMYFDETLQQTVLDHFASVLRIGGALVIGKHECIPPHDAFTAWFDDERIYRRRSGAENAA